MDGNVNDKPPDHQPGISGHYNNSDIPAELNASPAPGAEPDKNVLGNSLHPGTPHQFVPDAMATKSHLELGNKSYPESEITAGQTSPRAVLKREETPMSDAFIDHPGNATVDNGVDVSVTPVKKEESDNKVCLASLTEDAAIYISSDEEEESLFVDQGLIDFTSETEEVSLQRKKRLLELDARQKRDLMNFHPDLYEIKEEEINSNPLIEFPEFTKDPQDDSDYSADSEESSEDGLPARRKRSVKKGKIKGKVIVTIERPTTPDETEDVGVDPDDIQDQLIGFEARQRMLSRREANSVLKPAELKELDGIKARITKLKVVLEALAEANAVDEPSGDNQEAGEELNELLGGAAAGSAADSDDSTDQENERLRGIVKHTFQSHLSVNQSRTRTGSKRKAVRNQRRAVKKMRTVSGSSVKKARTRREEASERHQKLISDNLVPEDSIAAGQEMTSMPVLEGFSATKAGEQKKHLRSIEAACGDSEEKKRMRGDRIMMDRARGALKRKYTVQDHKCLIKGMKTPLFNYQFAGTGWMVARENSTTGPKGGILADSMGLGKTLETLACTVGNPPSEDDLENGLFRTLIVVPANAVNQWIDEIYRHGDNLHAAQYKESARHRMAQLNSCNIWLVSYQEVSSHYPTNAAIKAREHDDSLSKEDCDARRMKHSGPLMKMKFLRVILDEAHAIKNWQSHTSASCIALTSKYRWALSGTPIHNRVDEIYPYMRFLKVDRTSSRKDFSKNYLPTAKDQEPEFMKKREALSALLEQVMLKRTMRTKFFGHALFKLPKPRVLKDVKVPMSREETIIYRRVEDKFRKRAVKDLDKPLGPGFVTNWLLYVLRLRQAVAHPFLLESLMRQEFEAEDYVWLKGELSQIRTDRPLILQIGSWCEEEQQHRSDIEHKDIDAAGLNAQFDFLPQLQKLERRKEMLDKMEDGEDTSDMVGADGAEQDISELCKRCGLPPDSGFSPKCGHLFCQECIEGHITAMAEGVAQGLDCSECSRLVSNIKSSMRNGSSGQPRSSDENVTNSGSGRRARKRKGRGRGDDVNGLQPTSSTKLESLLIQESDKKSADELTPSAKTIVLKNIIMDWRSRYPGDKMIIFTQFVDMGRIIGRILQKEDIPFLYFFGSMSQTQKYQAQEDFTKKEEIGILVASLQCSGQALNLACANRIFILDLWWNYAMEQQAFGRVYRMGQTKRTVRARIMVKNTIDERMAELQAKKIKAIDAAIRDHDSSRMVLTNEEVAGLLGRVIFDEHGRMKDIVSDYDDESDDSYDESDEEEDSSDDETRSEISSQGSGRGSSGTQ